MPDNIRHTLAHRPGQQRIDGWGQRSSSVLDSAIHPGGFQELPRGVELARQLWLPVASDSLTHLAQGLSGHTLDLLDFVCRPQRLLLDQASRQFTLQDNQG
jgi:hypothetical protein